MGDQEFEPHRLIALTPQAACECELRGLDYLKLEDFFDVTAFLEADEPMLTLQRRWADRVDAFSWASLPELRSAGLGPAGQYIFFLKLLIDTLYRATFALAHLLLAAGPRPVVYFEAPLSGRPDETLFFPRPVYSAVLARSAEVYGAEIAAMPAQSGATPATTGGWGARRALERSLSPRMVARLVAVKQHGVRGLASTQRWGGQPEVVCHRVYDIEYAAPYLEQGGYRVTPLDSILTRNRRRRRKLRHELSDLWPGLLAERFFGEPFTWAGVDLTPLALSRLERWWHQIVPAMWDASISARQRFQRRRPQAFVLYSPVTPEQHGALQAARSAGVPTVTVQHGGFEGNCDYTTYDLTDLRLADNRLAYGRATAEYLRERAVGAGLGTHVIATGSPRLDAVRSRTDQRAEVRRRLVLPDDAPVVAYVPTSYQYNWYMSRGAYLAAPYFQLLIRVTAVLARFEPVRILYKPFPEEPLDPIVRWIQRNHPNIKVIRHTPFTELLDAADACVIDIPSTALLEALLTPKPVLAYADARFVTLRPEARKLLSRRTLLSEKPEEFLAQLEGFLARGRFGELTNPDDSFLRAYGTDLDDGRAAERVAVALAEVAAAGSPARSSASDRLPEANL